MSKVAIVGVEGSGKTVLMAALGELYGQASHDNLYLMPENQAAFAFMTRIPHKMRVEQQWPEATAIESMKHMKWTVRVGAEVLTELEMLDYPGELYHMAFGDRKEPEVDSAKDQIHEFLEHLVTADFLIVLLNLKDAMDIGANMRNNETVWLTRGIFDYAKKLPNVKNRLLVFTQADRYRNLLEAEGSAKALQEKFLPMLSILHPDLECTAISAVESPESEAPSSQPTTDGGLQELMSQIVMTSETGRHALDVFAKCQKVATEATQAFASINELDQAIRQYACTMDLVERTDAWIISTMYPGALDSHAERLKLLEEYLSELHAVRASNSVPLLAREDTWSSLVEKYHEIPNFLETIRNIIKFYGRRVRSKRTTRRIIGGIVFCAIVICVYFVRQAWIDMKNENMAQDAEIDWTVFFEHLFNKDSQKEASEIIQPIKTEKIVKHGTEQTLIFKPSTLTDEEPAVSLSTSETEQKSHSFESKSWWLTDNQPFKSKPWWMTEEENRQRLEEAEKYKRIVEQKVDLEKYSESQVYDMCMAVKEIQKLNRLTGSNYDWQEFTYNQAFDMRVTAEEIQKLNRLTGRNYDWRKFTFSQAFEMRMKAENRLP